MKLTIVWFLFCLALLPGCNSGGDTSTDSESANANALLEDFFDERVAEQPMFQAQLGIKDRYDEWDDVSDVQAQADIERVKRNRKRLETSVDYASLDEQTQLSYDLYMVESQREIDNFKWRFHDYPVNQMYGWQSNVPAFLINYHRVDDVTDAQAYIRRLERVPALFDQVIDGLQARADRGVIPPKFVFPYVIGDARNVIRGRPFDADGDDSTILADFRTKVEALNIPDSEKDALVSEAEVALENRLLPAYIKLAEYMEQLSQHATSEDGVWKLPDGAAYYNRRLKNMTTTDLTADEIHTLGLAEVARIHAEMRDIMRKVGHEGDLQEFFAFMREDPQFYYDDTDVGRDTYLAGATLLIDNMRARLDELFLTQPKADIVVKAVEPFREKSAGKAFYQRPSPDGSRPGTYYANLYRMADMPTYQMEALAYHEGIPGHHMQLAIAVELDDIPRFRKYGRYTSHTEGWGLYSEYLPKEIGFYDDPYSDFGRLAMELWRACRLVVDTGIHDKRWTRQEAIEYLLVNTPNPEGDAVKAIERYIVMPGQATAYKIGMIKILELRENARERMGDQFDIRGFHDVVLKNGPVPLNTLEGLVDDWVTQSMTAQ